MPIRRTTRRKIKRKSKARGVSDFRLMHEEEEKRKKEALAEENPFSDIAPLKDAAKDQVHDLIVKKLELCCQVFNFMNSKSCVAGKEMKKDTLEELCGYIGTMEKEAMESLYPVVIKMVSANVFRPILVKEYPDYDVNQDEEDAEGEPSWPHLMLVYKFFLKFLEAARFDSAVGKEYLTKDFVIQFSDLFDSTDPRERAQVKDIYHRIYIMFPNLRTFMKQHVTNILLRFLYETHQMNGISELLDFMCSIIRGLVLPLKKEHEIFVKKVLIPLHIPGTFALYQKALFHCIVEFIQKDGNFAKEVILGLLKFWPEMRASKQVLFLREIEEILAEINVQYFEPIHVPLFKRLAICISSPNCMVAQQALRMCMNDWVTGLYRKRTKTIFPIILPTLFKISDNHWHNKTSYAVADVLKLFKEWDSELFHALKDEHEKRKESKENSPEKNLTEKDPLEKE